MSNADSAISKRFDPLLTFDGHLDGSVVRAPAVRQGI
jgi:hypothetical protein